MDTVSYLTINDETKEIADIASRNEIENMAAVLAAHNDDIEYIQIETSPQGSFAMSIDEAQMTALAAQASAIAANEAAISADEKAVSAQSAADRAWDYADSASTAASNAWDKAQDAEDAANEAQGQAESAATAANVAWGQARDAASAANEAKDKADAAGVAANNALDKADLASAAAANAQQSAGQANTYANGALASMSTLESVIDTVKWFRDHRVLSTDTQVNTEKNYYIYNSSTGTLSKVTPEGSENPSNEGWYEIDETIQNYVASHVAETNDGLYIASNHTNGWRILVSPGTNNYPAGIYLIDNYGVIKQSTTGTGISFDENTPFHIGNEDAYLTFSKDQNNNGVLNIGGNNVNIYGNVTMGGSKTLSQVLNDLGQAITVIEYGIGESPTNYDDIEEWSTEAPEWEADKYIWMRTSTNNQMFNYTCIQGAAGPEGPQGIQGVQGEQGEPGSEGIGIESVVIEYGVSDSEFNMPGPNSWRPSLNDFIPDEEEESSPIEDNTSGNSKDNTSNDTSTDNGSSSNVNDSEGIIEVEDSENIEYNDDAYVDDTEEDTSGTFIPLTQGTWLWTRTTTTYTDGTSSTSYQKTYIGTDGQDGESVYIESTSRDENTKTTTVTLIDSNGNEATLTIKDGQDGAQGQPGANGKTIHIAWADNIVINQDNTITASGFSTSNSTNKKFMGVYTDTEQNDSEQPSAYNWSLIKGADGVSVTVDNIKYAKSATDVQPNDSDFDLRMPTTSKGEWLWVKTTYSDGSTAITKSYIGTDGEDGNSVSIGSVNKANGKTTVSLVSSDGTPIPDLIIEDGKEGSKGDKGDDGKTVHIAWANQIVLKQDGSIEQENSGFSTSISSGKNYLGVYSNTEINDSEDINDYSWSLIKGENGYSTVRILLYKRAASAPERPSSTLTYTFNTNSLTGNLNGWNMDIPSGDNPCWVIAATATGTGNDDTISSNEWTQPVKILENGAAGLNQATVMLYQRNSNKPAKPANNLTYTFSTGNLSGTLGAWEKTIPASNGNPCWITTAVAISNNTQDTIEPNDWADPVKFVVDGEDGKILNILPGTYTLSDLPDISTVQDGDAYLVDDGDKQYDLYYKGSRATSWTIVENWQGVEGPQGEQGIQGPKGDRGPQGYSISQITNYYLATDKSSGVTISTSGWSSDATTQVMTSTNKYLWNYEITKNSNNDTISTTTPTIIGVYGEDGDAGKDGKGITSIVEYYARSATSTVPNNNEFSTTIIAPNADYQYLWNYQVINYTTGNPTTTDKHIIGFYGDKGEAGVSISSITNYYLATAQADNVTTSTSGWTTDIQTMTSEKQYLWNYEVVKGSDNSTLNTTRPTIIGRYGQNGSKGDPGRGIVSITEYYQVSNDDTNAPTTWSTNVINTDSVNKYLWNYEKITYTDSTTEESDKRIIGTHGEKGTSVRVISNDTTYTSSTSGTNIPSSGWDSSIPTVAQGDYLWTRVITTFSDSTSATSYTVARQGTNGTNGTSVTILNTEYGYQLSTNGTSPPTGTWESTPQAPTTTQYAWTRTITHYSNGSDATTYTVGGKTGVDGTSSYTYIRYGTDAAGSGMTATPTSSTTYIGVYVGNSSTAPTTASSYKWTKFVGDKGQKGDKGDKGDTGQTGATGPEAVVTVTPSNINWDDNGGKGSATLTANLRVNGVITNPASYNWTKGTDTTSLGTAKTLTVNDLNATYNCTVTW